MQAFEQVPNGDGTLPRMGLPEIALQLRAAAAPETVIALSRREDEVMRCLSVTLKVFSVGFLLDEATAALDSKAEAEVQAAIDRLAEHRTVVCVAHRLSTLASMDRIIVLSEGRIVEAGAFEELLRKDGAFAAMAARQGIFRAHRQPEAIRK